MGFQGGLNIAQGILALAPAILQLIQAIESLIPQHGAGPAKKALAMSTVQSAPPAVQQAVSQLIDDAVAARNAAAAPPSVAQ